MDLTRASKVVKSPSVALKAWELEYEHVHGQTDSAESRCKHYKSPSGSAKMDAKNMSPGFRSKKMSRKLSPTWSEDMFFDLARLGFFTRLFLVENGNLGNILGFYRESG